MIIKLIIYLDSWALLNATKTWLSKLLRPEEDSNIAYVEKYIMINIIESQINKVHIYISIHTNILW